ncbi:MAG TPA: helix-turn-helix transcriptional regulator [Ktedonobacteraceae bacterium]|jgi:transcriptional regulator with XRE-family HTH domain|nr:helix-turn-helix transcriptional regulator [Ktedonobacteraceae bacterium]
MDLEQYRLLCGWSKNEMARQAGTDASTVGKALKGQLVTIATADKLATAISKKLGRSVPWQAIEGLKVKV